MTIVETAASIARSDRTTGTDELAVALGIDPNKHSKYQQIRRRARRLGYEAMILGENAWILTEKSKPHN